MLATCIVSIYIYLYSYIYSCGYIHIYLWQLTPQLYRPRQTIPDASPLPLATATHSAHQPTNCTAAVTNTPLLQADMPIPPVITPVALPRQPSPLYASKPAAYSTGITATAAVQSNSISAVATQHSAASTLASQHSSSSTATAAVLASLRQQHGAVGQAAASQSSAEQRQQAGQESQATATSRR